MGRLRGEGNDGEDAAGGAAGVRQGRVPPRGRGGGGARWAAPGEAGRQRAAPVGAQVRPQAATTTTLARPTYLYDLPSRLQYTGGGTYTTHEPGNTYVIMLRTLVVATFL